MADEQSRREEEDLNNRENPFQSLDDNNTRYIKRKEFNIPPNLVKEKEPDDSSIHVFEYDIPKAYFQWKGVYKCTSLFFSLLKKQQVYGHAMVLHKNFLVIKFSERQDDDSLMERDGVVENLLRTGVVYKECDFNILGCSNSQVQKKSFVFMKGSHVDCKNQLQKMIPDLDQIQREKGVAKRVKYTGLLFTGCRYMVKLPANLRIIEEKDITNPRFNFTDGCGMISLRLAKEIVELNQELKKDWRGVIPVSYTHLTLPTICSV